MSMMPQITQPQYQTSQEVIPRKEKAYVGHRIWQEIKVSVRVQCTEGAEWLPQLQKLRFAFVLFETLECSPTVLWPWADLPSKGQSCQADRTRRWPPGQLHPTSCGLHFGFFCSTLWECYRETLGRGLHVGIEAGHAAVLPPAWGHVPPGCEEMR